MKNIKVLVLLSFLVAHAGVKAQKVEFPQSGITTTNILTIKSVEITDTATVIDFHARFIPGYWIKIPKSTYIFDVDNQVKHYVSGTLGIPFDEEFYMPQSGETEYSVIFPPIDPKVSRIDYGEDGGDWRIFDIILKEESFTRFLPSEIMGYWFRDQQLGLALLDTLAIYEMQIWNYSSVDSIAGTILLSKNQETRKFYYNLKEDGHLMFGNSPLDLSEYSRNRDYVSQSWTADKTGFTEPLFNSGKGVLKGYIKGYSPRIGIRTGILRVNDIITGDDNSILLSINSDGTFYADFSLYHPQLIFVQSDIFNGYVFMEPGQELFLVVDHTRQKMLHGEIPFLFMGQNADINKTLYTHMDFFRYHPSDLMENILKISSDEYKTRILNDLQNTLEKLHAIESMGQLNTKTTQFLLNELSYIYYGLILEYEMQVRNAWYLKTNEWASDFSQTGLSVPGLDYYRFMNDDLVNNPLALVSNSYSQFLRQINYLDVLNEVSPYISEIGIMEILKTEGHEFTAEEKKLMHILRAIQTSECDSVFIKISQMTPQLHAFINSHMEQVNEVMAETSNPDQEDLVLLLADKLEEKGIALGEEDQKLLSNYKQLFKTDCIKNYMAEFQKEEHKIMLTDFHANRKEDIHRINMQNMISTKILRLKEYFGIQEGIGTDIIYTSYIRQRIGEGVNPFSDGELALHKKKIVTPFIAQYFEEYNENVKSRLEKNRRAGGFTIHEVSQSEPEALFANIMERYRGKLVYVDFWATWCGPCRSSIQEIKPLKEELEEMDIAFVYITGPSSPRGTWENMITDIKGDHYYLTHDEWNLVSTFFNIRGIPHYVLVNKHGNVIDANVSRMSNDLLKNYFITHLEQD